MRIRQPRGPILDKIIGISLDFRAKSGMPGPAATLGGEVRWLGAAGCQAVAGPIENFKIDGGGAAGLSLHTWEIMEK